MNGIVESEAKIDGHAVRFDPAKDATFSSAALETYAFARREAVVIDAMTVVAAVEFMDRAFRRSAMGWARVLEVEIPVYDIERWKDSTVMGRLHDVLTFLTGDNWSISFVKRAGNPPTKPQDTLPLPSETKAVIAYSDGLDSRAVCGLIGRIDPHGLLRVRVGSKAVAGQKVAGRPVPFTGIPYQLNVERRRVEASGRSRGFKFALFAGMAAYLADASEIIVPESGQGVFGPALVPVMHAYPDFRNHPLFTKRMEELIQVVFGHEVNFNFPRIWSTKAETLKAYVDDLHAVDWRETRSCWQDSRWCSFDGKRRQCGICAACLLRRMSVYAAGLSEPNESFICENLQGASLGACVVPGFTHCGESFREYAIAGVLQLDHFGDLKDRTDLISRQSSLVAQALSIDEVTAEANLGNLIVRHRAEWISFVESQGSCSFLRDWTRGAA